ncbi:hypothetical protein PLESTB_000512500 [Pleodorina starrii]|uniref:Uncharacterized protein n=1 Tax=Pleodorina starrii TaxID=330485 RepID=A0A9W6BHD8_9CHLO|nr:hypothetical protein PLESTB_000512500 [Pleodorina starrii]GLC72297.1 hypothetical protein PLESTF_001232500 [Pleodorina starrii]
MQQAAAQRQPERQAAAAAQTAPMVAATAVPSVNYIMPPPTISFGGTIGPDVFVGFQKSIKSQPICPDHKKMMTVSFAERSITPPGYGGAAAASPYTQGIGGASAANPYTKGVGGAATANPNVQGVGGAAANGGQQGLQAWSSSCRDLALVQRIHDMRDEFVVGVLYKLHDFDRFKSRKCDGGCQSKQGGA